MWDTDDRLVGGGRNWIMVKRTTIGERNVRRGFSGFRVRPAYRLAVFAARRYYKLFVSVLAGNCHHIWPVQSMLGAFTLIEVTSGDNNT